jgi:hypothetical protein
LLENDGWTGYFDIVPVGKATDVENLDFLRKVSGLGLFTEMKPIDHLDSIAVINVSDVQIVFELNDFETLNFLEYRFFVVKKHSVGICDIEKCPISVNLRFGISWPMRPNALIIWL